MPSALENLIKILRQEKQTGFANQAVIGGLGAYAPNWAVSARQESRHAEQLALVEELLRVIADYEGADGPNQRESLAQYMFDRITRRVEAKPEYHVEITPEMMPAAPPPPKERDSIPPPSATPRKPSLAQHEKEQFNVPQKADFRAGPAIPRPPAHKPRHRKRNAANPAQAVAFFDLLNQPPTIISGVGDKMAEKLGNLGVSTVGDLLYLFPRRYDDYTQMVPLNRLQPYQNYTVVGTIRRVLERKSSGGRPILVATLADGAGQMDVSFFNQPWLKRQLQVGMQLVFSGKTELFLGNITMNNPAWEPIDQESLHTGGLVPIYPLTKGISARVMRRIMHNMVEQFASTLPDYLPESVRERANQVDLDWALRQVHFPERQEYADYARERLAFDELLFLQLGVLKTRAEWQSVAGIPLQVSEDWPAGFEGALPFALTDAQSRAIDTLRQEIAKDVPMNRLLQGDVGSGKTMVAAALLAMAAENGHQAALMAPTSILAEQHYQKMAELLPTLPNLEGIRVALLTGSLSEGQRREVYAGLADGTIQVVVGTQAIIQEGVEFYNLAAAVIDEQHRFGVQQRGALRGKGNNPHLLVMTATPIPRTLALTMFADLDLTILDEMPPGRTPIQTRIVEYRKRLRIYEFLEDVVLSRGQQIYVIYPLVEASERSEAASAEEGYEFLKTSIFPRHRVGLVHGRMRPAEKEAVMEAFAKHELDVLASTSVIEVGVDVPNATAIVIENAERFGLAQLHQFRGRVGRGSLKSYCILLSDEESPRLQALEETADGFKLAERDWQERGAGDLLGLRQSGGSVIRLAEQMSIELVELAQQESRAIFAEDPILEQPEHQLLAQFATRVRDRRTDVS